MDTVTVSFSKEELFKLLSGRTYNVIHAMSESNRVLGNHVTEMYVDVEQHNWFLAALNRADALVRSRIAHITDNSQMIEQLKAKIANVNTQEDDTLIYMIKLSHHLQLYMISDAIEDALVAEMCRQWCIQKKLDQPADYVDIMSRLKSISLMVESRNRRNYLIN